MAGAARKCTRTSPNTTGSSPSTVTANYIKANPQVRVNAGRRWRTGVARIVDEDPNARLDEIVALNPRAGRNARIVRAGAQWRSKPSEVISRIGDEAAALMTRTPGSSR
jgi:hypothetical protein